jgi:hypothetical protein
VSLQKNRIQSIIDNLSTGDNKNKKNIDKQSIWKEIQIIGEPFLKDKLIEMYYLKFDKAKRISELKEELYRLEND